MAPDRDAPGEALFGEVARAATDMGLCLHRMELPEGCKDYGEWWAAGGATADDG